MPRILVVDDQSHVRAAILTLQKPFRVKALVELIEKSLRPAAAAAAAFEPYPLD